MVSVLIIIIITKIILIIINCPGGVNGDQFISSLEQFDKSGNSWNVPLRRDWRIINQVKIVMMMTMMMMTIVMMTMMKVMMSMVKIMTVIAMMMAKTRVETVGMFL